MGGSACFVCGTDTCDADEARVDVDDDLEKVRLFLGEMDCSDVLDMREIEGWRVTTS
jgi:hypothetical protein